MVRSTPGNQRDAAFRGVSRERLQIELMVVQGDRQRVVLQRGGAIDQLDVVAGSCLGIVRDGHGVDFSICLRYLRTIAVGRL
jgi:hypothetical protein